MKSLTSCTAILFILLYGASPALAEDDSATFFKQLGASSITDQAGRLIVRFADGTNVTIEDGHITTVDKNGDRFLTDGSGLAVKLAGDKEITYIPDVRMF